MTSRPKLRLVAPASTPSPGRAIPARDADDELVAHEPSGITPAGPRSAPMSRATLGALGELEDDHLVALAIQGEMRAAEMLYRRHAAFAFNLAARIAGSTNDMEDVVHDAFLKAFDNLSNLRNPRAFRTWLGSIVVHAVRSRLRRARFVRLFGLGRGGDPIDIDCIAAEDASPRQRAELAQLYALLQTLPADERIAWTLRFVEGNDLKEAAVLSGCSLATIKRRIRRASRYIETHYVAGSGEHAALELHDRDASRHEVGAGDDQPESSPRKTQPKKARTS